MRQSKVGMAVEAASSPPMALSWWSTPVITHRLQKCTAAAAVLCTHAVAPCLIAAAAAAAPAEQLSALKLVEAPLIVGDDGHAALEAAAKPDVHRFCNEPPVGFDSSPIWQSSLDTVCKKTQKAGNCKDLQEIAKSLEGSGWKPLVVLGHGSFGSCAIVSKAKTLGVAKIAKKREEFLSVEYSLLRWVEQAGGKGFAKPLAFRGERGNAVLVQQLLGPNLWELRAFMGGRFSLKTCLMIGSQLLQRLEFLHRNNIYYGDLKPDNICVGLGNALNTIYLIDFGLVRMWRESNTHAVNSLDVECAKQGNKMFFGLWHRCGLQPVPRDDLLALGHLIIALHLPERYRFDKEGDYVKTVASMPVEVLCEGLPGELEIFLRYVRELTAEEEVDYHYLQKLLADAYRRCGFAVDGQMDWANAQGDM